MPSEAVLLAETDRATLDILPQVLSHLLDHVSIDICTSANELACNLRKNTHDTVAISPLLIQDYRLAKSKKPFQLLAPLLVTASPEQQSLAQSALETDAFDVIVKPIVPQEAAQTVQLALWQSRLLRLLTEKDLAVSRFREHMAAFPHAQTMEEHFASKMAAYDRTVHALQSSMRLLLNVEDEQSIFDMAASVAQYRKQWAFNRLNNLPDVGATH